MAKGLIGDVENKKQNTVFAVSVVLAIVFGAGVSLLSELAILFIPFLAGALASIYILDITKRHWVSFLISFAVIFSDLSLNPKGSVWAAAAVLIAAIITIWFIRNAGKAFFVGLSTVVLSFLIILAVYLVAFSEVGFNFQLATELLKTEADKLREMLDTTLTAILSTAGDDERVAALLAEGLVPKTVELYMSLLPSLLVISSLAVSALAYVIFLFLIGLVSKKRARGADIFCTSPIFAIFFIILAIFNMFESDGSVFNVAMINLYNVFLVVYAYVGFRFATYLLGQKIKSLAISIIIISFLCVMFSGFALNLLSIIGVFETFAVSRMFADKNKGGGNGYE